MKILIVSEHYYPALSGVTTQMRMVAGALASRHSIEVAALFLKKDSPKWRNALEPLKAGRTKKALKQLRIWNLLKMIQNSLFVLDYESYVDGMIPVNVINAATLDRLRMLPVAPPRSATRERYERVFRSVYVPKLRSLIRGKDLVHAVCADYYGWAAEEAARAEGVPFVLTPYVHPGDLGDDPANVDFYKRADMVFALIETGAQKLIQLGVPPERLRLSGVAPLLPEHVDPRNFRLRHGLGDKPVVLFIGRMVEYKGYLAILDAAKRVWREMADVQFLFAGPAGTADSTQRVAERGDQRARYLGLISDQEKGDALAACDLFCMPSTAEILPAVYLEAWSYGKAVIGGTADGLRELIEGNGGGVIVEQNPDVLAAQVINLLRNEPRRRQMGVCGRALVERRFSEDAVVGAMEQAYLELSQARAAGTA